MVKSDSFKNRLKDVPKNPGVYLHSNVKKEIIYVGKANSLQDRLKYYFSPQIDATPKIKELMNNIHDFDFIVTESEQEALLLENQLIKKYQPKYNARLKDDKSYPYIKITKSEEFPQIVISRNPKNDKNKYYGPYSSISSVRQTLDLLSKIFPYRTCTKEITGKDKKACLEFDIGRCKAPCIGNSDQAEYEEIISSVEKFLSGKTSPIVKEIKNEMVKASNAQNYERAAVYRDRIKAIERILEKQKVSGLRYETFDLISCVKIDNEAMIIVFNIRKGNMIAHEKFRIERTESTEVEEIIRSIPGVEDVAVIGIPDTVWGEKIIAIVVPKNTSSVNDEEIIEYCHDHLSSFKKPEKVIFENNLPTNPLGKVLKNLLRDKYSKFKS